MKGSYFLGNGQFQLRNMPMQHLQPDEVRIQNMASGVCGTDVHIYHGDKGSAAVNPPVVLGHEYSGIVLETGSAVKGLRAGDHVAVDPNQYCGVCSFCRNGQKQLCDNLFAIGVNRDGGFAQQSTVTQALCHRLDGGVSFLAGAMAEPLSCCLHGIERIGVRAGETVLVMGGGAIGLLMVQLAKHHGACDVIVSEPIAFRRDTALQIGATLCTAPENLSDTVAQSTGGHGVDVIIECSGSQAAAQQALRVARKGTRILFFGVPAPDAVIQLPLFDVFSKEWMIAGSFINPDTFARAIRLLNEGSIQVLPLITHTYGLAEVSQAITMQMSTASLKVMVLPNGHEATKTVAQGGIS